MDMKSLGIRSYDSLYECETVAQVMSGLDLLGVPEDPAKRILFLNDFMGVTEASGCGVSTPEEDYNVTCEELVFINSHRKSGSPG